MLLSIKWRRERGSFEGLFTYFLPDYECYYNVSPFLLLVPGMWLIGRWGYLFLHSAHDTSLTYEEHH